MKNQYNALTNPDVPLALRPKSIEDPSDRRPPTKKEIAPLTLQGLQGALGVTERDLETFRPNEHHLKVGEAFLAGHSSVAQIATYTGLGDQAIKDVLNDCCAMQWISRRTEALFRSRVAVIDCALYLRAAGGDLRAMELFYKRMKLLEEAAKRVDVNYSGGINLTAISNEELTRILVDQAKLLPAEFRILESRSVDEPPKPTDAEPK